MGDESHPLRGARPTGSVEGLKLEEIRRRLRSTQPGAVSQAGHAYNDAAAKLAAAQAELATAARYIQERWKGPAATEALKALGKLQETAQELSTKSSQTGKALQQYGEKILPWYQTHLPSDGLVQTGGDDKYAQRVMAKLNGRISQTYDAMPQTVRFDLPSIGGESQSVSWLVEPSGGTGPSPVPPPPGRRGPYGGEGPGSGLGGGHGLGREHEPGSPGAGDSQGGDGSAPGSDLQSFPPAPGTGPGLHPGQGVPGAGTAPGGVAPGAGPGLGGVIGTGGWGNTGSAPRGRGFDSAKPASVRDARFGTSGGGRGATVGGLPAGTAGAHKEEKERERSIWLPEDKDTWFDDEMVPPIIEIPAETSIEDHEDLPRPDVDEDEIRDLLDELEDELGPEIVELDEVELGEEDHGSGQEQDPALDHHLDDLLDGLLDDDDAGDRDDTGHGDPQTAK